MAKKASAPAPNLFAIAKEQAPVGKKKTNDKTIIRIVGKEFDKNMKRFAELNLQLDEIKTELAVVQGIVKEMSIEEFCKLYAKDRKNPGSCFIMSDSGAKYMLIPNDKYITIDDKRAAELVEKYDDEEKEDSIVTETTTFSFNPELLDKYAAVISDLINKSNKIHPDDKSKLIVASKNVTVSKGTIDKACVLSEDVSVFIADVQPVFGMKNPEK